MDALRRMVRQSLRGLRRSPAFTVSVILLLALGVGSASAIFAVVDHVLLRRLPYPASERLFTVENGSHSGPAFAEFHGMASVEAWSAASTDYANLTGEGEPLRVVQTSISPDFFRMFGARAAVGRLFVAGDYRPAAGAVLSWGLWRRVFGGADIIGRTIRLNGDPVVVVGVVDLSFAPPEALIGERVDVWRPLNPDRPMATSRNYVDLSVVGRLAPHARLADAGRGAQRIAEQRARAFPDHYRNERGRIAELPVVALQEATVGRVRERLTLLLSVVTLLLLVACANVTHLYLARGVSRVHEMSLRRTLGASTGSLVGPLLA